MEETLLFSNRSLLQLFYPIVLEQLLIIFAGFTDSIMAASLGEAAVSGVSMIDNIVVLLILVFTALASGGAVLMGQYLGRGDLSQAQESGRQTVWISALLSLVLMAAFYGARTLIFTDLYGGTEPDVMRSATDYFNVIGLSIPFVALNQAGSAIFRTAGNTKFPMLVVLGTDIFNVFGNYTAIFILRWGVTGTAISTLLSRMISAAVVLYVAQHANFSLRLPNIFRGRLEKSLIYRILKVGIPFSIENGLFQLGKIVVYSVVTGFGTSAIAAYAVGTTLTGFQALPGVAMNTGSTTVISRCLGAGKIEQSRYYTKKIILWIMVADLSATILLFLLWPGFVHIYDFPAATMDLVFQTLLWHGVLEVLIWPLTFTLPVVFRSAGDARFAMIVGVISMMAIRVGGAYVLCGPLHCGMMGAWYAMFLDWVVRAVIYVPHYLNRSYLRHKLI